MKCSAVLDSEFFTREQEIAVFQAMHNHGLDCERVLRACPMIMVRTQSEELPDLMVAFHELKYMNELRLKASALDQRYLLLMARGDLATIPALGQILSAPHHAYDAARAVIVSSYFRLAMNIASEFRGRGFDIDELQTVALSGLAHSIDRFDVDEGSRMSTYATVCIEGWIKNELARTSRLIQIPRHLTELTHSFRLVYKKISQGQEAKPTPEQCAEEMKIGLDDAEALVRLVSDHMSLDEPQGSGTLDMHATLVGPVVRASEHEQQLMMETIDQACAILSPRDTMILHMFFGLYDGYEYLASEIGLILGRSRTWVLTKRDYIMERLANKSKLQEAYDGVF